jgi:SP family facilitated glucose transporter-like MFS transporter 8
MSVVLKCYLNLVQITKSKPEDAERSMRLLRGSKHNCDDELNEIKQHSKSDSEELSFIQHLKEKPTRKAFFIILAQFFFFQFTGINAVVQYTQTIFIEAGIGLEPGVASIFVVSSQLVGILISTVLVDKFGRRVLMFVSTIFMAVCHISIGGYFYVKNSGGSVDGFSWLPIVSLSLFEVAFGCGIGPVSYVLLGELFTPKAKKVIAPIGKSFNLFMAFVVGLFFPNLVLFIGTAATFFMFAGFSVLALVFSIFFIPETKGKSLIEIQEMLN